MADDLKKIQYDYTIRQLFNNQDRISLKPIYSTFANQILIKTFRLYENIRNDEPPSPSKKKSG